MTKNLSNLTENLKGQTVVVTVSKGEETTEHVGRVANVGSFSDDDNSYFDLLPLNNRKKDTKFISLYGLYGERVISIKDKENPKIEYFSQPRN